MNSLAVTEDKNHLKGVTKFSEVMKYLREKYHRPQEVSASILAKGQRMKKAGECMKTSKANMLLMLEIRRDLRKLALEHKIDAFYIKTISIKVFTRDVRKIGPQLGISPISGHFWPKIGLGLGWGLKIFKNCGQGWGWGCKIKENCG